MSRSDVLAEVAAERQRQKEKWGEQNHPDGTGHYTTPLARIVYNGPIAPGNGSTHYAFGLAQMAKSATDKATQQRLCTWADILLEEVFEALAEDDPTALRTELIQVAAVATQWAQAIDRRQAAGAMPTEPLPPLTADDFQVQYDAERTFSFWEDEDTRITGYGHPDKTLAADQVTDYWRYTSGEHFAPLDPSEVHYRWAVRLPDNEDGEHVLRWADENGPFTEQTPGAFPVWTVAL